MSEVPRKITEVPNNNRVRIFALLALSAILTVGCEYDLDEVCQSEGYDGASQNAKDNWAKIKTREKEKGNYVHNILLGIGDRELCFGYRNAIKANGNEDGKIFCEGRVGNCAGKKKKK